MAKAKRTNVVLAAAVAFAALLAMADARHPLKERKLQDSSVTYLLDINGQPAQSALSDALVAAGCSLDWFVSDAGLATAKCPAGVTLSEATPGLAGLGVASVAPDGEAPLVFEPADTQSPPVSSEAVADDEMASRRMMTDTTAPFYTGPLYGSAGEPNDAWYLKYGWAPRSIGAPAAWAKGINGRCVRVAVISGNFGGSDVNKDLKNKFDFNASKSFVEGYPLGSGNGVPYGQWVSSVLGAEANNNYVAVGVAYGSTLIGIRVGDDTGHGMASDTMKGVVYAAQRRDKGGAGADVINLSWGGLKGTSPKKPYYEIRVGTINKALAYANKNGVVVVAAAGGGGRDLGTLKSTFYSYCESPNVICVVANGPSGSCPKCDLSNPATVNYRCLTNLDFNGTNYSRLASYSDYGEVTAVTAPGGTFDTKPSPCYADDGILVVQGANLVNWAIGTAQATPHVSALAAMYIQKAAMDAGALESELCNPGRTKTFIPPAQVKTAIMRGAVLPPGNVGAMRQLFGFGIINVPKTLGL